MRSSKILDRARFAKDLVLVDGITRSGKFLLAHVVSALEGVEFLQYTFLLENLLFLLRAGKVDLETCRGLLHLDIDMRVIDLALGRYLNTRASDMSSIQNSLDAQRYAARAATTDRAALLEAFAAERRLPLFVCHEGLSNGRALFELLPEAKSLYIMRDPATLIRSWFKRGWGRRSGHNDPQTMWI